MEFGPIIKPNEEILIRLVAGFDKSRKRFLDEICSAAHRIRSVKENTNTNRDILNAEKTYLLWNLIIEDRKGLLSQSLNRHEALVYDRHSKPDLISDGGL